MAAAAGTHDAVKRATGRVIAERDRAARAATVAAKHELLAAAAEVPLLRTFHQEVAHAHRVMEKRHLISAGIQASHVARLRARPPGSGRANTPTSARRGALDTYPGAWDSAELLGHQATHDPLTDLPNRALFTARLADAMREVGPVRRRVGVCLIDLDNFRAVNDRLGHEVGDRLLIALARRLAARISGRLLARLGGDEFAVLLEDTTGAGDATAVADAALAGIGESIAIDGHELTVTASIGVVERRVAGADPTEILRAADVSLTWAKQGGKRRWTVFDVDRDHEAIARYALAAALPAAIERGEFFLEYQPIVALADERIVLAEALVRWNHPVLGVLYPDQFIGLAEESGMIADLGRAVLMQACHDAAEWSKGTPDPPTVSVNVAARQIYDADLVADVATALKQADLPPSRLRLEITESAMVRPGDAPAGALWDLVKLGVTIAIDDFGTGYSNLSYLRRLPVHAFKIDRAFVAELSPANGDDPADLQIVAAMVSLAHVLGLTVTAEGVENSYQADALRSIGCDHAQGWFFGRPASAEHLKDAIAAK